MSPSRESRFASATRRHPRPSHGLLEWHSSDRLSADPLYMRIYARSVFTLTPPPPPRFGLRLKFGEIQGRRVRPPSYPQAHLTKRMKPTNAQPIANRPEAIMSKNARTPAPSAANLAQANLPTKTSPKAQPSQAHQGKSDGLINIAAISAGYYLLKAPGARPVKANVYSHYVCLDTVPILHPHKFYTPILCAPFLA